MDPLAVWVDLEPPLAAVGSGPAMAVRVWPCRGAARRWRVHPSTGTRTGERARRGAILLRVARRGAARRWRVHPSAGARAGERARGGAVGASCGAAWHEED
jgi:hypothetical protein